MKVVVAVLVVLVVAAVIQLRKARRNEARQSRLIERGTDTRVQTRARRQGLGTRAFHAPPQRQALRRNPDDRSPERER